MSPTSLVKKIAALPAAEQERVTALVDELMAKAKAARTEDPLVVRIRERRERLRRDFGNFGTLDTLRELRDEGR